MWDKINQLIRNVQLRKHQLEVSNDAVAAMDASTCIKDCSRLPVRSGGVTLDMLPTVLKMDIWVYREALDCLEDLIPVKPLARTMPSERTQRVLHLCEGVVS